MIDRILLPASDQGVALQVVVILVGVATTWWLLDAHRYWRPAVLGIGLLLLGAIGVRAAH